MRAFVAPFSRVLMAVLPLLAYGASFSYRSARPDTVGVALLALTAVGWSLNTDRDRRVALFVCGLPVAWAGFQDVALAVVLAGFLFLLYRQRLRDLLWLGMGIAVGGFLLLGFSWIQGGLVAFLITTVGSQNAATGRLAQFVIMHDAKGVAFLQPVGDAVMIYLGNPTVDFLLATGLALALRQDVRRYPSARRLLSLGSLSLTVLPLVLVLLGKFPLYYHWMAELPAGAAFLAAGSVAFWNSSSRVTRRLAEGGVSVACLVGLPLALGPVAAMDTAMRSYEPVRAMVRATLGQLIKPSDWVYVDPQAYMAVTEVGATAVLVSYARSRFMATDMPQDQKQLINFAILNPNNVDYDVDAALARLGGNWTLKRTLVPSMFIPAIITLPFLQPHGLPIRYTLQVYKRE
jgi:hypothetical protein